MKDINFKGVHTALITPFTKKDNLDEERLGELIEAQITSGVNGLVPCGTTGESPTLSHDEHDQMIAMTVKFVNGRVPVIAGTGSNATSEAVRLSRHAQQVGADAVLLVNPYYNKPTQKGLYYHFKAIADSVDIPCILYNIKGRTGVNIETETVKALSDACSNIVGVKEASGSLEQMRSVIDATHGKFHVLSGDDKLSIPLIESGGDGVVSVASNIAPGYIAKMIHLALEGKWEQAREMESQLSGFFQACFLETNPIPIKTAMARYGWCEESFRLPMCTFEREEHRNALYEELDKLEALGAIIRR
ncbi:4-hydroxy-tetrahydrodipicolinate synthase [Sphaerochaeta halotolerans]|jgi:4-hydroxy-tetrahydrodipicolinate synthase|uniref:4-hydroxy-tetrahydrodipicolinate synthase n=1 Tax=Sphaerochaeta halotolerans TaxID=2293840 RepID=A0A372MIA0_9SPIR|nr:4-hydroxy-tetrahydrodipicolinate synthase [Sphaerochaeta halotolerans]MBG0766566.1 4-hydroxy-tetrahydrodipicolinate synthase [Spirochaetaceae bacterium]MDK2858851.1 4-hydroxy-tetrahydrodipicolinate synthase [Sphaerochaeta sp.]MDN5333322.1 4-hydroxy-tetrahydrodipicolinate synthase [Sphaerochaeta sp.]MXI86648.1 4-hydroxy-tetrahydrodipicolinate synthase [Sphaerochaeta halotolerans]RFU94900.1 4-hydroxy-tetrahydrodipicolinate synthase [Sphaerochaeta halotolerans]